MELLIIRHGESEANAGLTVDPDSVLTPLGIEQARNAGRRLVDFDLRGFVALTSPYRRTLQTASQISAITGLSFSIDEGIREFGVTTTIDGRCYPQETGEELIARLRDFLDRFAGRRVILVSHAAPIAVLLQLVWGEEPTTDDDFWRGVNNACVRWLKTTVRPMCDRQELQRSKGSGCSDLHCEQDVSTSSLP